MRFHFEKLGLLDQADIELADLTLICGENNTGKTYATYAVYGFLRSWRQILRFLLEDEIDQVLKDASQYRIDLAAMFNGKIDSYLERMGKAYVGGLPRAFATESNVFEKTICVPSTCQTTDYVTQAYQRTVQAGPSGKVLATLKKESGSPLLDVLVADAEMLQRPFGGLTDFIADAIADIVFAPHLPRVHIASAERTGAAIFRKELDMARTRMLKTLNEIDSKELKRNPLKILQGIETDYAWPVEDNVDFVRQLEDIDKRTGELAKAHPELLAAFDAIIGGSYKVVKQQLVFQAKGAGKQRFTMNEASSCIRALLDVGFYLRCRARAGDVFIIDEPELNLHPKNQRAFARLVARMVNAGIKVFITTHSDYLVKEINTLIMLHQRTPHTKTVQQQYGYDEAELINPQRICMYITGLQKAVSGRGKARTLIPATIYPDRGIEVSTFDETIETMNAIQSEILYGGEF
ncbi:MAG: ATP-binding protein [Candidatus Competibacteraceae bacterium]|jgi:archaellum biogenesis ATPase FlaH|nr:MAG: ATP-binding protein [Candidatus Competibacteraceae bacterium]